MGNCEKCGAEFEAYCAKCRTDIKQGKDLKIGELIPVLFVEKTEDSIYYRTGCYVNDCPCNVGNMCSVRYSIIPIQQLHNWDGDNIILTRCG